jgi:hypothetical protein
MHTPFVDESSAAVLCAEGDDGPTTMKELDRKLNEP